MTVQTCCGGIPSNDPNVSETSQPYMTRSCYPHDSWNVSECSMACCGSEDATCIPTSEGGYCVRDGSFYKYLRKPGETNKERFDVNRNAIMSETDYRTRERIPDFPTTNRYNEARYRDTKRQVLQDMQNEQMNVQILHQKRTGDYPFIDFDYESFFDVAEWVTPVMALFVVILFMGIVITLSNYL